MFSKKLSQTLLVGLVFAGASITASAGHDAYEDRGRVISVTPQVERVNVPVQECRTEYVRESYYENNQRSSGGGIIGAVAGGVIGSRFGGGNGRLIATAVGAGLGAVIGDRHSNRNNQRQHVETRPVERCTSIDRWETVDRGYLVDYEYNGRRYTTETLDRPGKFIPVDVSVRPAVGYIDNIDYRYEKHGKKHHRKHHGDSYRRYR